MQNKCWLIVSFSCLMVVGFGGASVADSAVAATANDAPQTGGKSAQEASATIKSSNAKATKPASAPATKTTSAAATKSASAKSSKRAVVDNPTSRERGGDPDLKDFYRHAAWIVVDGEEGRTIEQDGFMQMQWMIDGPVSRSPTFRVDAYEALLGSPKDFRCVLQTHEAIDDSKVSYIIDAKPGTFETGKAYELLHPGDRFVITDTLLGKTIDQIPLLSAGTYGLVGAVKNAATGKEGVAITYFTVGEEVSADETDKPAAEAKSPDGNPKSPAGNPKSPDKAPSDDETPAKGATPEKP